LTGAAHAREQAVADPAGAQTVDEAGAQRAERAFGARKQQRAEFRRARR
jgi:hypothetical protein